MIGELSRAIANITLRFRGYEPQPLNPIRLFAWLRTFEPTDRTGALRLLNSVRYVTRKEFREGLLDANDRLLNRLADSGIAPDHVIYVSIDGAGSSSQEVLAFLRNHGRLDVIGAKVVDTNERTRIPRLTFEVAEGALIYVDDFIGTGNQFRKNRNGVGGLINGNFVEFLLAYCACEEGIQTASSFGVETITCLEHGRTDRPMLEGPVLTPSERMRLTRVALSRNSKYGLGYRGLASNVVLYRNAPNTLPLVLRGGLRQSPAGIFPRHSDMPPRT